MVHLVMFSVRKRLYAIMEEVSSVRASIQLEGFYRRGVFMTSCFPLS